MVSRDRDDRPTSYSIDSRHPTRISRDVPKIGSGVIGYMVYRSSSRYKVLVIGRYRYVAISAPQ